LSFRDQLLDGRRVAFAGGDGGPIPGQLTRLGARVDLIGETAGAGEDAAMAWVAERSPLHGLVFDGGAGFGSGGEDGLRAVLGLVWISARAVATGALIPGGAGGRLLFVAPRTDAGPFAQAARSALENLARTLSVEWARFAVTAVAVCPGPHTSDDEVAELVCFLLSDAGGYFTGCRFELGAVAEASTRA
jgi:NAD(P)-dependent dehydrogenase (short-subunit alcohol dehydrogenase family)